MINPIWDGRDRKISRVHPKYVVLDDFFDPSYIRECEKEFLELDDSDFVRYTNPLFEFEKYALNSVEKMPEKLAGLFKYIHSDDFIKVVSEITEIKDLLVDENRWGGGLHMTKKTGYLAVHKDFNILPTTYNEDKQMLRCINLIGYMNSSWKESDGGELEFWDETGTNPRVTIAPCFNRWVLFDTRNNYHGHPFPYKGETPRMSIASYYYIRTKTLEEEWMSTDYLKLPWMEETQEYSEERKRRADHKLRYQGLLKK